jgi:uncharacterized protein (DUF58 family)
MTSVHAVRAGPGSDRVLRALQLTVRRRLDGLLQGEYAGLRLGPGSEPAEIRAYRPGEDDVRRIDWNVTARTQVPHVRAPMAEHELESWVLVDGSASMDFGTAVIEKRELAAAMVGAIGLITGRPGNRMGVRVLHGGTLHRLPARPARAAAWAAVRTLIETPRAEPGADTGLDLGGAVTRLIRDHRRPGLRVVVSDFLADGGGTDRPFGWEGPMRRLAARHDTVAVEVLDPRELELPQMGLLTLVDPETGRRRDVQTSSRRLRERYAAAALAHRGAVGAALREAGVAHLILRTDQDWVTDLARFVRARRRTAAIARARARRAAR